MYIPESKNMHNNDKVNIIHSAFRKLYHLGFDSTFQKISPHKLSLSDSFASLEGL